MTKQKQRTSATPPVQALNAAQTSGDWKPWAIAGMAFLIFALGLGNPMVAMDDHTATVDNPAVRDFALFGHFNLGMYAPVTWAVYAFAMMLGADAEHPMMFHLLSALIHAANAFLVYRLALRLSFSRSVTLLTALFFAIHPLQVEAVAWIAGLSTPLYAFFSLLSLDLYVRHTQENRAWSRLFWLSLGAFVLAGLAKSAAVALPLSMLVIDAWLRRPLKTYWLEKVPFFLVALGFGALTLVSRTAAGHTGETIATVYSFADRLLMAAHTIWFYWFKTILPLGLSIWYPFVKTAEGWHWTYYAAPAGLLALAAILWWKRAAWRGPILALLFWLANIVFALPWATFGTFELRSDRYNYLACLGIFILIASLIERLKARQTFIAAGIGTVLVMLWTSVTVRRIQDWSDMIRLIDKAIAAQGDNHGKAYLWRGMEYGDRHFKGDLQRALDDFSKAIEINPELIEAYKYRGGLLGMARQYDKSIADLDKYLARFPDDAEYRYNRAISLSKLNRYDEALKDFDAAVKANPDFTPAWGGRGNTYMILGDSVKGQADMAEFERRRTLEMQQKKEKK